MWSGPKGMFLRTQHFQQQDRWVEAYVQGAVAGLAGHAWGFRKLELNTALLTTGKIAVAAAVGRLPDGTPFSIPDGADHPVPLQTTEATREGIVHLCLPAQQPGAPEIDADGKAGSGARLRGGNHRDQGSDRRHGRPRAGRDRATRAQLASRER